MSPKISVIMPVYNAGEHIKPCLDTLTKQTLQDIEIVCILDCPTDGTDKIIEAYAAQDERIKVVINERNLNIGESRNRGLAVATGEYIGFSDHDDYRELNMYEDLYKKAKESDATIVLSGPLGMQAAKWEQSNPTNWEETTFNNQVKRRFTSHIHPHIYKRSFIQENQIKFIDNNTHTMEDTLFNARAFSKVVADKLVMKTIAHNYYVHVEYANNQNKSYNYWALDKVVNSIHEMQHSAKINPIPQGCIAEFCIRSLYTSFQREVGKYGILATLKRFRSLKKDEDVTKSLNAYKTFWNETFTFPKNIFALFIKAII